MLHIHPKLKCVTETSVILVSILMQCHAMSADLFLEVRNFHCNPYGVPVAPGLTSPNYDGLLPAPDGAAWAPQSLARDDSLPFLW